MNDTYNSYQQLETCRIFQTYFQWQLVQINPNLNITILISRIVSNTNWNSLNSCRLVAYVVVSDTYFVIKLCRLQNKGIIS